MIERGIQNIFKQGRMIKEIDQDVGVTLVTLTQGEDQPEDQLRVLNTAQVLANVAKTNVHTYTKRRRAVSTGSGGISTAIKDKGKGKMEESEDEQTMRIKLQQEQERLGHEAAVRLQEELDKEERQRMAKVHKAAQSFTEEEWENIRATVEVDEELSKRLQAVERSAEAELDHESSKRQKTNQASRSVQEQSEEEEKELSQEDLQQMMMVVLVEEVYVETLQIKYQSLTGRFTLKNLENIGRSSGRAQKGNSSIKRSKWDKSYARGASAVQVTIEERIDYDEVFALVARIEAIRLFLAYASFKDFVVYQMDVKSAFLYGKIEEEVYQAPMETHKPLLKDADGEDVDEHLYRSMIGSLMYLTSSRPDVMFVKGTPLENHKHHGLKDAYSEDVDEHLYGSMIGSLMYLTSSRPNIMLADSPFDLVSYTDSDYARASLDRKSITGAPRLKMSVNGEVQLQALMDRRRFVQVFVNKQVGDMSHHKRIYVTPSHTKKIFGNMKREGKGFSRRVTPLFQTMMVQAHEEMGEGSEIPTDPHHTPIITQPSSSQPQRKQKSRKSKKKNTEVPQPSGSTDNVPDENVPTTSNDPLLSGEDRLKLTELMDLCTNLQKKVLDLEKAKTAQDSEIASLKKKVKKLERRNKSRTPGLKRLRKVGSARRVESSDEASLGDQEDASKQGRKIADIDADAEVTLIDETQGRNDDNLMFDTGVLDEQEVEVEKVVSTAEVTTESATTTTVDELTLAQTLIEIKAAKPKVRGVMIQEPSEFTTTTTTTTPAASKPSQDKGKAKMIESEKPLKKKDQIMYDQEVALNLQAQLQAELEEEERLTRQKEEEANIALIESWDNTQAMMDADYQMAQQLQAEEQEQLSIEEKSKLFVQLLEARKKHFVEMRAREKRNKPPTQAQQRKLYSNYLKNMEGYTLKQLKGFKFEVINDMFDKAFKRLEQEVAKKQKLDDDQEEAEMKKLIKVVPDEEEVAIDAIPLATKPLSIVDWKIVKEGKISLFQIIRANGSSKRYSSMIQMLKDFDREDLETLWKLMKAKHGSIRPKEGYERVLWGI
ncbi:putative ribonuclease H-like domain-containing protein [Tanacetum coccineum]